MSEDIILGYDRASMLDLAILAGGSLDCVFALCELNGVSLTDYVEVGQGYSLRGIEDVDKETTIRIRNERIKPATHTDARQLSEVTCGGIGFMGIDIDFEVS